MHSAPPVVQLSGQTITCVYFLSPRSSLTSPLPRQERSVVSPSWKTGVQFLFVSAQESLVRWACVVPQCLQSEPGGAARQSLQMNNLFSQLCNILWSHARPPDRDTRSPTRNTHHNRPSRRQPRWWTNECFRALVARNSAWRAYRRCGSLSDYSRFSHRRLLFQRLVRSSRRALWRRWQHNIQQIHNRNPQACASQIRRCFRLPPRIAPSTMAWSPGLDDSTQLPSRVCDRWRSHFWSVASSQDTHYSLDFFNLISSHFVDLTSASSSGPFDAPFSAPELAQALAQCHDSAPDMMVSRTPPSSQISRGGVACCSIFSTWSCTGTRCRRRGRSAQSFLCSNMETPQVQASTAPSL